MLKHWISAATLTACSFAGSAYADGIYSFYGLRDFDAATSVADDGTVFLTGSGAGYLWTPGTGAAQINGGYNGQLTGDGAFCVGDYPGGGYLQHIGVGLQQLPPIPGGFTPSPRGVSTDGSVVVGVASGGNNGWRWTEATGMVLIAPGSFCEAQDVSRDGQRVVGRLGSVPFIQTQGSGTQSLGAYNGRDVTEFRRLSANGQVIVGDAYSGSSPLQGEALRWTSGGGYVSLGAIAPLPGNVDQDYRALAVNGDGTLIADSQGDRRAWIWDPQNGMRDLHDVLANQFHYDLTNWTLTEVLDISADGQYLVGDGVYHNGTASEYRAFVAIIPAPGGLLPVSAMLFLAARRRRPR